MTGLSHPIRREDLAARTEGVLSRGNWGNPDVLLVSDGERSVVVKDFAPRAVWLRRTWGTWSTARELRAYRALEGAPCVPRALGRIDAFAFAAEYRPGTRVSRALAGEVPEGFVDELREAVAAMHARGVVHLDLRHRSNVLAGEDGHPVILDFATALRFRPGGWASRWIQPLLARVDRGAVRKWELRLAPQRLE